MTEPDWNPDTGGRSLAEILREAGIESATRSRRRRWDDPEETAIRQRRADAAAETSGRAGYGRRRSDQGPPPAASPPRPQEARRAVAVEPSTSAIPGLRPDRKPGVPAAAAPAAAAPATAAPAAVAPATTAVAAVAPARERRAEPAAERAPQRTAPEPAANRSRARSAVEEDAHPSTGPIPVVRAEDIDEDLEATPRESALAWLRFGGELVIALAAGVGIYFAATVLWEIVPYLAVLLVPVAVTGLVLGVGMWRRRLGHEPVGPRLLATLVFAGTLLTVAPAAGLLASG